MRLCDVGRLVPPGHDDHESFYQPSRLNAEVDLLIKSGRQILPIEIKLGAAVDQYLDSRSLRE